MPASVVPALRRGSDFFGPGIFVSVATSRKSVSGAVATVLYAILLVIAGASVSKPEAARGPATIRLPR